MGFFDSFGSITEKIGSVFHSFKEKVSDNDTLILTGFSCLGVFATGILAFKAGPEVIDACNECNADIDDILRDDLPPEDARQMIDECKRKRNKRVAKAVARPIITGAATIGCDVLREKKWSDKFKDLALLYAINQKKFDDFKEKTKEIVGQGKVEKIDDEITKDKAREKLYSNDIHEIQNTGSGTTLYMCADTGQLFYASRQFIEDAFNKFNRDVVINGIDVETPGDDLLYYLGLKNCKLIENMVFDPSHLAEPRFTCSNETVNGVMREISILEITGNKRPQWRDSLL